MLWTLAALDSTAEVGNWMLERVELLLRFSKGICCRLLTEYKVWVYVHAVCLGLMVIMAIIITMERATVMEMVMVTVMWIVMVIAIVMVMVMVMVIVMLMLMVMETVIVMVMVMVTAMVLKVLSQTDWLHHCQCWRFHRLKAFNWPKLPDTKSIYIAKRFQWKTLPLPLFSFSRYHSLQ